MKLWKRALSATLAGLMLFAGSSVCTAANTNEQQDVKEFAPAKNNSTFVMYKDGDYYRFSGTTGDGGKTQSDDDCAETLREVYRADKDEVAAVGNEALPSSVDLSKSQYFPAVGNQGGLGSCAVFSCVYYQYTYEKNKIMDVPAAYDNTASPLFVFNFTNSGSDLGTTYESNYEYLSLYGAPSLATVPYTDKGPLNWFANEDVFREAARCRLESYTEYPDVGSADTMITSADDEDLYAYKKALSDGKILGFSTNIESWVVTTLKTNPAAPGNDEVGGEYVAIYSDGYKGPHRMTIVGYNDDIWTDVNSNNQVDEGELGAFKIVNSWGDGYCNGGFIWVTYDALNYTATSVDNGYSGYRAPVITFVTSCDVREYNDLNDLYVKFTVNTAKRTQMTINVSGEKDGTIVSKNIFGLISYQNEPNEGAFDGTQTACDGTFLFCLDNVIEGVAPEEFEDYRWTITFEDEVEDGNPLVIKSAEVVNAATGMSYSTPTELPLYLDGSSQELELKESTSTNKVIYYTGYYDAVLNYKNEAGEFVSVEMESNTERTGYVNKYVICDFPEDVVLYFSDKEGNKDDNNGNFYTADSRLNYFTTEGVCEELRINGVSFINGEIDLEKLMKTTIDTTGGYEPYHYQLTVENTDTGQTTFRDYNYLWYIQQPTWVFRSVGTYRFFVEVMDHTGKVVNFETFIDVQDLPFEFASFEKTEGTHFVGENINFLATSVNEGVFSHGLSKNVYEFVLKDSEGNVCHTVSKNSDFADFSERYSKTAIDYIPHKKGTYTVTVSSTDVKKQTAEISLTFTVYDKTIGDANADGGVNVKDATAIQKYIAGLIAQEQIYGELSDCDGNEDINVKDATMIQRYAAGIEPCGNAGNIVEYIPPQEPPAPPTEQPDEPEIPPVEVKKNIVTFTNSLRWSGTIYCYYWSASNNSMTSWPGAVMNYSTTNEYGEAVYTFEVPEGADMIIFSNGTSQTVDIAYPGGEIKYYAVDSLVSNKYEVKTWQ